MEELRFSVGQYTTPGLSFAEDLRVYEAAGAQGVGIDTGLKIRDWTEDLARFRDSPLAATYCFPATSSVHFGTMARGSRDPAVRVDEICEGLRALAPFDPICISCGPGPAPDRAAWQVAVDGLKRVGSRWSLTWTPMIRGACSRVCLSRSGVSHRCHTS